MALVNCLRTRSCPGNRLALAQLNVDLTKLGDDLVDRMLFLFLERLLPGRARRNSLTFHGPILGDLTICDSRCCWHSYRERMTA